MLPQVDFAVEGAVDVPPAQALIRSAGAVPGTSYQQNGSAKLDRATPSYSRAAQRVPWLILRDLDAEPCPVAFRRGLLKVEGRFLCYRLVIRAIEAWLLADFEAIALFLDVPASAVPREPETLPRPKRTIVDLAARSSNLSVRRSLVPRAGSGREVGAGYPASMVQFGRQHWTLERALRSRRCPSLERAQTRLREVIATYAASS